MDTFDVNDADYRTGVVVAFFEFFLGPVYMEMGDPRWGEVTRLAVVEK